MKPASQRIVHSTHGKSYGKLTKKEHIGRELELWGEITYLELKLKAAQKNVRSLRLKLKESSIPRKHYYNEH